VITRREYQFISIASCVGMAYALLITGITRIFSSQAVGAVGIGLTAFATAACSKYQKSLFEDPADDAMQHPSSLWITVMLMFAFNGTQVFLGMLYEILLAKFPALPSISGKNLAFNIAFVTVSYILTSSLIVGVIPWISLGLVAWGAFFSYVCNLFIGLLPFIIRHNWRLIWKAFRPLQAVCFLYVMAACVPFLVASLRVREGTPARRVSAS